MTSTKRPVILNRSVDKIFNDDRSILNAQKIESKNFSSFISLKKILSSVNLNPAQSFLFNIKGNPIYGTKLHKNGLTLSRVIILRFGQCMAFC